MLKKRFIFYEVFNYISSRCRSLKHMTLDKLSILGSISKKTGFLLVDMPYTFLKTLEIGQVPYSTLEYSFFMDTNIDEKDERKRNENDSEYPISASHIIDWISVYKYIKRNRDKYLTTTKLSNKGATITLEYYQDFQSNKTDQILEDFGLYDEADQSICDKCNLSEGCGELRFGKVETVHVVRDSSLGKDINSERAKSLIKTPKLKSKIYKLQLSSNQFDDRNNCSELDSTFHFARSRLCSKSQMSKFLTLNTISELPFEILAQIADKLSTTDRLTCALTCKGWRYLFQKALLRDMQIYSYYKIQETINEIRTYRNESTSLPLLVYSLKIQHYYNMTEISSIAFSDLFVYLPNLKALELCVEPYIDIEVEIPLPKKIWKSLESLKIQYRGIYDTRPAIHLCRFINTYHMVQRLELLDEGNFGCIEFSVNDFENMHQNIRNLSSIKASIYLSPYTWSRLDNFSDTMPAFAVTSLDINFKNKSIKFSSSSQNKWNPLWLSYFGYKYPNLRSLKLTTTNTWGNSTNSDERQTIISLFQSNPNAFRHLKTFSFTVNNHFALSDLVILELLCVLRAPLRHVALNTTRNQEADCSYPLNVNRILRSFSKTLESLLLTGFTYSNHTKNPVLKLSLYCPLLTNLCIIGRNISLNLKDLLNKCVALKQLKFGGGKLFTNLNMTTKEPEQQQKEHGLQILSLEKCSANASTFKHISFRCKNLQHMTLNIVSVTELIWETTGYFLLDMSHTFLRTLKIGRIRYEISNRYIKKKDYICLTLLSQLNGHRLADKKKIDTEYPKYPYHNIDWLYTYKYCVRDDIYLLITKILPKNGANIALESYQNSRSKKAGPALKGANLYEGNDPKVYWECELFKGFGELRFGNIESVSYISQTYYRKYF
ncbi:hypothetical protein J3Q64DRAFT_1699237 [Phycomyces blakesleeanus]|uniref:F-box domain-containing protein n=2 Tax=Phycomyces blakesleeanus TaxID=4837 RepID=A0A162U595_PHYB8|nr:hypothetical protein PHYBLDRAFT_168886 [Phycomyces blakesleeanus NRRL 1555(-)]OAD73542.1 hypothetical protein PHYBLDRAFT_168886 [Phycomyces blakesleeanus NRRL 1555(-)]|eukprot:XP_018291582.1 hypothetical protein PHYBLDRAFT_168886 [Phycomyces blakesleeanus NRRL 1555(-)]